MYQLTVMDDSVFMSTRRAVKSEWIECIKICNC